MTERVVGIRGLVKGTIINDITEHFSVAGDVEKVKFEYDESAELPTEAYILFKHKTSGETAIAGPNFSEFKGSKLQIRPITISQEKCLTEWLSQLETKPPNSDLKDALAYINRLSLADKNAVLIALGGNPDKTVERDVATGVNQPATLQASVISPHNLLHIPNIPLFNGEKTKAQVNCDQWSFEVWCLQNSKLYTESTLLQGIRRSLRGTAADAFKHMGENVTVNAVLKRFEVRFGNVLSNDQLWEEFYTAHQKPGESHYGVNFIQRLRTPTAWKRAYQCMSHKVDKKIDGCLGSVKSTSAVTIPADQSANIHGITHLDFDETESQLWQMKVILVHFLQVFY